jgi:transcriptional regulator with PAS, ATPase and Fis domain
VREVFSAMYPKIDEIIWQRDLDDHDATTIIDSITDGIVVTDADHKIILINKSSALLRSYSYDTVIGKSVFDLISTGIIRYPAASEFTELTNQIKSGNPAKFELVINNNKKVFAVIGHPIYKHPDTVYRIVYTSNDKPRNNMNKLTDQTRVQVNSVKGSPFINLTGDVRFFSYSDSMQPVIQLAQKVAVVDSPVFLTGESGVGKNVLAQCIHNLSKRKEQPFIQINCAAIPESLFESEVFGYDPGAFTGANRQGKQGLMETAGEGTLFLDEIAELSIALQAKFLQVMQEGLFRRVGGTTPIQLKARVISATNQDIEELVQSKRFREDLYYRMCVVPIDIPPLRERWEDTMLIAEGLINQFNEKYGTHKYFSGDVRVWMHQYEWPGNIRELRNVVERLAIISEGDEIALSDIPATLQKRTKQLNGFFNQKMSLKEANEKIERTLIEKVLNETKSSREAAATLGISQSTLLRKVNKYRLQWWE